MLPTGYYFGASATTGDLSDNHDIIAIKMYELDLLDSVRFGIIIIFLIAHSSVGRGYMETQC